MADIVGGLEVRRYPDGQNTWGVTTPNVNGYGTAWWPMQRRREAVAFRKILLGVTPGGDFGKLRGDTGELRPDVPRELFRRYRWMQRLVETVDGRRQRGECLSCAGRTHPAGFPCKPDTAGGSAWVDPEDLGWVG